MLRERIQSKVALEQTLVVHNQLELRELARGTAAAVDVAALHARTQVLASGLPIPTGLRKGRFDDIRSVSTGSSSCSHSSWPITRARPGGCPGTENDRARLESFSAMAALMRQDASALPKAVAKVRAGSPVDGPLLDAIGSAGTADAQHALAELASDTALATVLRQSAAMSLIRVKEPIAANVSVLRALSSNPLLREYAVYGLGTASRRLRAAGQETPAGEATAALLSLLAAAPDDDSRMIVLRGISNSADVRTLPHVKPFLSHAAHGVRHAAIDALRLMQSPDADAWLAERLLQDVNVSVQAAAIAAAAGRAPSGRMATRSPKPACAARTRCAPPRRRTRFAMARSPARARRRLGAGRKGREAPEIRELARGALARGKTATN